LEWAAQHGQPVKGDRR